MCACVECTLDAVAILAAILSSSFSIVYVFCLLLIKLTFCAKHTLETQVEWGGGGLEISKYFATNSLKLFQVFSHPRPAAHLIS